MRQFGVVLAHEKETTLMKRLRYFALGLVLMNLPALAATRVTTMVECEGTYEGEREALRVKIGEDGKIQEFSPKHMAKVLAGSYSGGLGQDTEEYGYEWTKTLSLRNGITILEMGTTADSFKLAISADRKRGSFNYRDLGSGSGSHEFEYTCKVFTR